MKKMIIAAIVGLILGAALARQFYTREVIKTVEHETVRDRIVTDVKEIKHTDGSIETTTHSTDDRASDRLTKITDVKPATKPNWFISGGLQIDRQFNVYSLHINRRVLGPIFVGGFGDSKGNLGVTVGVEF